MKPQQISNFIFNLDNYNYIFGPLKNINLSDYNFIMEVITKGADIKRSEIPPPYSQPNYPIKGTLLIEKVTEKFIKHIKLGQIEGPYKLSNAPLTKFPIHTSPLSCKLKSSGKPMMLIDESAPLGASINSEILDEDKSVSYSDFSDLCNLLLRVGPRGWLWIVDAVDAYYRIPIQDRFKHLFGIIWLNRLLLFNCLSFGLSTAPSIYNRFADLILWACIFWERKLYKCKNKFNIIHYLDDFFGGHKLKKVSLNQMNYLIKLFEFLNIPTNPSKCIGPSQDIAILGWRCVTFPSLMIGLASSKRIKYLNFIKNVYKLNTINFKTIEKSVGYLRHSSRVYLVGKIFVRGLERHKLLINSLIEKKLATKYTQFSLSDEEKFDISIWILLLSLKQYHLVDLKFVLKPKSITLNVFTDASTSFGAGGISLNKEIFHLPWSSLNLNSNHSFLKNFNINFKEHIIYLELFAIVLMAAIFAPNWKNKFIQFHCDNLTSSKAVHKGSLKFQSRLYFPKANLVKLLAVLALKYEFYFDCTPILGSKNPLADALSREDPINRNKVYKHINKSQFIPSTLASNIIKLTCINKFSNPSFVVETLNL